MNALCFIRVLPENDIAEDKAPTAVFGSQEVPVNLFLAVLISVIILFMFAFSVYRISRSGHHRSYLLVLLYVYIIIAVLRICVNVKVFTNINAFENVFDGLVHALQTFSMDEDYTFYLIEGKSLLGTDTLAASVYGICISVLNFFAPLLGGAVLLEVIFGVFPGIKLFLNQCNNVFVFSDLNESSILLAEDIMKDRHYTSLVRKTKFFFYIRPLIVFTDLEADSDEKGHSQLCERARSLRAVCLRGSIHHYSFRRTNSVSYLLMSEEIQKNIDDLVFFVHDPDGSGLWPRSYIQNVTGKVETVYKTSIYVFCRNDYQISVVDSVTKNLPKNIRQEVLIRPVNDYVNMTLNMLYDVPLFVPFIGNKIALAGDQHAAENLSNSGEMAVDETDSVIIPQKELHVTILGSGDIGKEVFRNVFWCGQMAGVQLHIHVLSENALEVKRKLQDSCPELFESCEPGSDILRIYPRADGVNRDRYAPPYAICKDFIEGIDAECIQTYPEQLLQKTDYYVAALGSDEKNIFVTRQLAMELTRRRYKQEEKNCVRTPVIVPIIFNDMVAESVRDLQAETYSSYIVPAGMLADRYSCKNVFMDDVTDHALNIDKLYNEKTQKARLRDQYGYWANIARAIHLPYKLFIMGYIPNMPLEELGNVLCALKDTVDEQKRREEEEAGNTLIPSGDLKNNVMAWMEHRRWNAYLRSQGFIHPSAKQQAAYALKTGKLKNLQLKFHSCLVESSLHLWEDEWISFPVRKTDHIDQLDLISAYDFFIKQYLLRDFPDKDNNSLNHNKYIFDKGDIAYFYDREELIFGTIGTFIERYGIKGKDGKEVTIDSEGHSEESRTFRFKCSEADYNDYKEYDKIAYDYVTSESLTAFRNKLGEHQSQHS